jgi:hypothetical protein
LLRKILLLKLPVLNHNLRRLCNLSHVRVLQFLQRLLVPNGLTFFRAGPSELCRVRLVKQSISERRRGGVSRVIGDILGVSQVPGVLSCCPELGSLRGRNGLAANHLMEGSRFGCSHIVYDPGPHRDGREYAF